ncbi:hypothetical protein F5883DRAFT_6589 [Diaporthe sp. PMI_573]|nr:hypothetical protein F5883DRAFT_6589 [Diaporthaceae sp. PMI_573]
MQVACSIFWMHVLLCHCSDLQQSCLFTADFQNLSRFRKVLRSVWNIFIILRLSFPVLMVQTGNWNTLTSVGSDEKGEEYMK